MRFLQQDRLNSPIQGGLLFLYVIGALTSTQRRVSRAAGSPRGGSHGPERRWTVPWLPALEGSRAPRAGRLKVPSGTREALPAGV